MKEKSKDTDLSSYKEQKSLYQRWQIVVVVMVVIGAFTSGEDPLDVAIITEVEEGEDTTQTEHADDGPEPRLAQQVEWNSDGQDALVVAPHTVVIRRADVQVIGAAGEVHIVDHRRVGIGP